MRAVSPVIAVVLLVALTVGAAASVALFAPAPPTVGPTAAFSASVDAGSDRVAVTHEGGASIDADPLRVRLSVGGEPVAHQPPVPFFAAAGYVSGPTGPFNAAHTGAWTAGETASLRLAGTNTPIERGDRVRVQVYAAGRPVADLTVRAG